MTRILLVRHAETVWHTENRYAGSTDIELTERGDRQAEALAGWAREAGVTRLFVSSMRRAQATIAPTAAALGVTPVVDARLRELDFGEGEGRTAAELTARMGDRYAAFQRDPFACPLPGGEDPRAAIERGREALVEIARSAAHDAVLNPGRGRTMVVAHNTLIRLLLCELLGIAPMHYRRVFPELGNVTITELGFRFEAGTTLLSVGLLRFNLPILNQLA